MIGLRFQLRSITTVGQLKDQIKGKKSPKFEHIPADALTLYRVDVLVLENEEIEEKLTNASLNDKLNPLRRLDKIYPSGLPDGEVVHIIVKPPSASTGSTVVRTGSKEEALDKLMPLPTNQKSEVDISLQLVARWSLPRAAESLQSLHIYLQQPLTEEEKIPISQKGFDLLSAPYYNRASWNQSVGPEELNTLFRGTPDRWYGRHLHFSWDLNISEIVTFILSDSRHIRNSNKGSSTGSKWPDYGLLIKNHCVFRGEEKGSDPVGNPEQELVTKLIYTYQPLTYILGYSAVATNVKYFAITSPPSRAELLFHHDIKTKKERIANLVHLIRLSGVMAWLGEQLSNRDRPEFMEITREDGLVQMRITDVVRKEFRHDDAITRVSNLVEIYKLLELNKVPNVDTLKSFNINTKNSHPHVYLSPVGIDTIPKSGSDAFDAIVCVLGALKAMHSGSTPVYHRDIRQPNIMKRFDGQGWFLIDFSDASTIPTRAATHLSESEHSPMVRHDNHGAEVDIWGVGRYLKDLTSRPSCGIAKSDAVKKMARKWMEDLETSAASALEEVMAAQDLFIAPQAPNRYS
ncbi:hypothetical protein FRC17_007263 [Serendipita sp. 399]|nr:hypothetical protein FRC17_007263 [Serendipita sp. 399]